MTQNAATLSQSSGSQGVYGGSGESSEQNGWQAYYTYAQQLRSAGDQEQAQQYYAYAQQLYIEELQNERQRASVDAQAWGNSDSQGYNATAVEQQAQQEYVTEVSPTPTWETYYNYAQQLYAAGHQTEAEAYYRRSQILYQEAESQTANHASTAPASSSIASAATTQGASSYAPQYNTSSAASSYIPSDSYASEGASSSNAYPSAASASNSYAAQSPAGTLYSYPPQSTAGAADPYAAQSNAAASSSYAPQSTAGTADSYATQSNAAASSSYAPQQSAYGTDATLLTSTANTWGTSDVDDEPEKRAKRPLKTRLKIWSTVIIALVLVVGIGGFFGLLSMYKSQLQLTVSEKRYDRSFLGKVKNATIQPMVDALQPTFDKTIRLSAAAQPLLYELSLRSTQPENLYPETAKTETPAEPVTAPQPVTEPAVETTVGDSAMAPTGQTEEEQAKGASASEAAEPTSEGQQAASDEKKDESSAAEATTEGASEKEEGGDERKPAEPAAAEEPDEKPSKKVSRRSKSKRKNRSRHSASHRSRQTKNPAQQPSSGKNQKSKLSDDPLGRFLL